MAQTPNGIELWKLRLIAEIKADKKKAVILGLLTLTAAIIGIKALVGNLPAHSDAAVLGVPQTTANASAPKTAAEEGARAIQTKRDEYIKKMDGTITRDIFALNPEYFPPQKTVEVAKVLPTSASAPAEDNREIQRQLIQEQARSLMLESTMVGTSAVAIINGTLLRVGDSIAGFKIVKITTHSCVVTKEDVTLSLEIKK